MATAAGTASSDEERLAQLGYAILYRDFNRHRDDATVLVAKW